MLRLKVKEEIEYSCEGCDNPLDTWIEVEPEEGKEPTRLCFTCMKEGMNLVSWWNHKLFLDKHFNYED